MFSVSDFRKHFDTSDHASFSLDRPRCSNGPELPGADDHEPDPDFTRANVSELRLIIMSVSDHVSIERQDSLRKWWYHFQLICFVLCRSKAIGFDSRVPSNANVLDHVYTIIEISSRVMHECDGTICIRLLQNSSFWQEAPRWSRKN